MKTHRERNSQMDGEMIGLTIAVGSRCRRCCQMVWRGNITEHTNYLVQRRRPRLKKKMVDVDESFVQVGWGNFDFLILRVIPAKICPFYVWNPPC